VAPPVGCLAPEVNEGAEMKSRIAEQLHEPLPETIEAACQAFDQLLPQLMEQGLQGQWVAVVSDGEYAVNEDYNILEENFEDLVEGGKAIVRRIEPTAAFYTLTFR
jgi:hypothetical protein